MPARQRPTVILRPSRTPRPKADLAELVRDKAVAQIHKGTAAVTTKDGLAAQALIDRREERRENREFMLNLAQLLSGAGRQAPDELIEGDFTELEPDSKLLAPPELRE